MNLINYLSSLTWYRQQHFGTEQGLWHLGRQLAAGHWLPREGRVGGAVRPRVAYDAHVLISPASCIDPVITNSYDLVLRS
jgi:hypothetical protein